MAGRKTGEGIPDKTIIRTIAEPAKTPSGSGTRSESNRLVCSATTEKLNIDATFAAAIASEKIQTQEEP